MKEGNVKNSLYSFLFSLGIVVFLILLNLFAQSLQWKIDMTGEYLYSVSKGAGEVLDQVKKPVTLFLIEERRVAEEIEVALEHYDNYSPLIEVKKINPIEEPQIVARYYQEPVPLADGSIIAVSGTLSRAIPAEEMFGVTVDGLLYASKVEQVIMSALLYLAGGDVPVIYEEFGLGGESYSSERVKLGTTIRLNNYLLKSFDLSINDTIPEDADLLSFYMPTRDLTERELQTLFQYIDRGGKILFSFLGPVPGDNFKKVLEWFGMEAEEGVVFEGDLSRVPFVRTVPTVFYPTLNEQLLINRDKEERILAQAASSVKKSKIVKKNTEVEVIMTNSSEGWLRVDTERLNTIEELDSDRKGPNIIIASSLVKNVDGYDSIGARLTFLGSPLMLMEFPQIGLYPPNEPYFIQLLGVAVDREEVLSIRTKNLVKVPLRINFNLFLLYAISLVGALPLSIITIGLLVWRKRKNL